MSYSAMDKFAKVVGLRTLFFSLYISESASVINSIIGTYFELPRHAYAETFKLVKFFLVNLKLYQILSTVRKSLC